MKLPIAEIFYSLQGEGPLVGQPFLFIRYYGCNLRCRYCDTTWSWDTSEKGYNRFDGSEFNSPVDSLNFQKILTGKPNRAVSLTGGEPLLYPLETEEIIAFFPDSQILIETNGTVKNGLTAELLKRVDVWSVDFKLPSVTGIDCWTLHRDFLTQLKTDKLVVLKAVFGPETTEQELDLAYSEALWYYQTHSNLQMVFQPLSEGTSVKFGQNLQKVMGIAEKSPFPVRIIPQIHKILNIP